MSREHEQGAKEAPIRRAWTRRLNAAVLAATAGVTAAILVAAGPAAVSGWLEDETGVRITPAQAGGPSHEGAPAVFAFLALDDAGLLDLSGDYYGIEDATELDDGTWRIGLLPRKCVATALLETCIEQNGDPFLEVALGNQEFRVVAASDEIEEPARRALGQFRKEYGALTGDTWVPSKAQLHVTPTSPHIEVALAWLGDIEASRSGHVCRGHLLDGAGNTTWTSDWRELPPPGSEDGRFGATTGFSGLPAGVDGTEEASVECDELHGLGWDAEGATVVADEDPALEVELALAWEAPAYLHHFTRCEVTVLDGEGNAIGTGEHWRAGPRAGEPPFAETVTVQTDADAESAADVEVSCGPVSGVDFETRETFE
jgi:hypothetical protein